MKMKLSAIVLPSMVTSLLFSCQFATPIASNVDFNNFHNYAKQSQPTPSSTPSASQSYSGDVVAQSTPVPPTSVATPSPYFSQPVDSSPPDKTIESPPATAVLSYGVVSGVVRNQTGTSQGGIEVRLRSLNFSLPFEAITTTNANGEYYFNAVPMGIQVELSATSSQFQPLQQTLVTNRENITYDLMLTAIPTTTIDPPPSDNGNGGKDDFTDTQTGTNNGGESTSPAIVEVPPPVDTTLPPPAQTNQSPLISDLQLPAEALLSPGAGTVLVRATAQGYDPDGPAPEFLWEVLGQQMTGSALNYNFPAGTHRVTVTARDNQGALSSPRTATLVVKSPSTVYSYHIVGASYTSSGTSYWGDPKASMSAAISGNMLTVTGRKLSGTFTENNQVLLKVGSGEHFGVDWTQTSLSAGMASVTLSKDLSQVHDQWPRKDIYLRFQAQSGGWVVVGPLTIERREETRYN